MPCRHTQQQATTCRKKAKYRATKSTDEEIRLNQRNPKKKSILLGRKMFQNQDLHK